MSSSQPPTCQKILEKYHTGSYYSSMKAMQALLTLGDIASEQWGMFTSAQARLRGISRVQVGRLHDIGAIERIRHGVYRVTSAPSEINEEIRAEWLSFRPEIIGYQRYNDPNDFVAIGTTALDLRVIGEFMSDGMSFAHNGRFQSTNSNVRISRRNIDFNRISIEFGVPALRTEWVIFELAREGYDLGSLANLAQEVQISSIELAHVWNGDKVSDQHERLLSEIQIREDKFYKYLSDNRAEFARGLAA